MCTSPTDDWVFKCNMSVKIVYLYINNMSYYYNQTKNLNKSVYVKLNYLVLNSLFSHLS